MVAIEDTDGLDAFLFEKLKHFERELQKIQSGVAAAQFVGARIRPLIKPYHYVDHGLAAAEST